MANYTKTKIVRVKDDFGDDIPLQALDDDGKAFDLSTYTSIKWRVAEPDATTYKILGTCVPVTASEGKVKYTVADGDFDEAPKTYNSMLVATKTGVEVKFEGVTVVVREEVTETAPT